MPRASARIALSTSPWETASHTAFSPLSASTAASRSRIADTARADISGSDSPSGNRAPEGWVCTVRQSFSLASFLSS